MVSMRAGIERELASRDRQYSDGYACRQNGRIPLARKLFH